MSRTRSTIFALIAILLCPLAANADLIHFDELSTGTIVNTLYSGVTFGTTFGSGDVIVYSACCSESDPNSIYPGSFLGDLSVTFDSAVDNLSFYIGGDNDVGAVGLIDIFGLGDALLDTIDLIADGDGAGTTEELQDLSAYSSVTRINIYNVTDTAGLVYDTFSFEAAAAVPEPGTLALLGIGLIGMGAARRKRKI